MVGNELQQLVMVSSEVWQDLHWRYTKELWPWLLMFIVCNCLVLFKSKQVLFFTYVALCWIFLGVFYFIHTVQQVHTFAIWMGSAFIFQGLALFYLKVLRVQPAKNEYYPRLKRFALSLYGVTALVPFSYLLENSAQSFLLFGWGAEQTSVGTIALVFFSVRSKVEVLLVLLPLAWIGFYALAL